MAGLPRVLGPGDLTLFVVVTTFSLRWIPLAAAAGPQALLLWALACLAMFLPLVVCVLDLASRFPREGGLYVWTREAFGPLTGFMAAWAYWTSNLVFFPGLLYFGAASLLTASGTSAEEAGPLWFAGVSLTGLAIAVVPNLLGLRFGKWLNGVGALGAWIPVALLIGLGGLALFRHGFASDPAPGLPAADTGGAPGLMLWSSMAFAFIGIEASALMAEEIRDPRRALPRAALLGGLIVTGLYIAGTAAILAALPAAEVGGLQGFTHAVSVLERRLNLSGLAPVCGVLISLNALGAVAAWFAAGARLPFAAGLDRCVPAALGRVHPRWGTPHVAILTQAAVSAACVIFSQAGSSVRGAYEVLLRLTLVATFVPFLLMFAAAFHLRRAARPVVGLAAATGLCTTAVALILALAPAPGQTDGDMATLKTMGGGALLLVAGAGFYYRSAPRAPAGGGPDRPGGGSDRPDSGSRHQGSG